MWAGVALSALSLVVTLATLGSLKDQIREQLAEQDTKVTEDAVNASYTAGIAFAVILGILGILLWLLMAWKNGQGRSWARIVATILAGLNVLLTLGGPAIGGTTGTSSGATRRGRRQARSRH